MNPNPPLLYGPPKIHKVDIPIRPVVSFSNTPVSKITQWLNHILKNSINIHSNFSIQNSIELTKQISSLNLPPKFSMVSFDVTNLFPSIPSSECLTLVTEHLLKTDLPDASIQLIISLLQLCSRQNYILQIQ
ncbi:hypothetical protein RI129_000341 [Pyrocoelia pectoralis]|uniref:Reverse transcriptase domain-containing protein n=1 Tax=Pyrocoelia pectoralis TaxID=417401 RepID=A0AAN7ZNT8_9COLE